MKMEIVTKEYTSKTCTNCFFISDNYNKRRKECEYWDYKIDIDINGVTKSKIFNS